MAARAEADAGGAACGDPRGALAGPAGPPAACCCCAARAAPPPPADADAACFCCFEAADAVALAPCTCGCRTLHVCAGCLWAMLARAPSQEIFQCTVCRRGHADAATLWALRHGRAQVRHLPLAAPAHYERVAQVIALLPLLECWTVAAEEARALAREFAALGPAHAGAARVGFELGRALARFGEHHEAEAVLRPVERQQAAVVRAERVHWNSMPAGTELPEVLPSARAHERTRLELVALQARFHKRGDYARPQAMGRQIERTARYIALWFEDLDGRDNRDCALAWGVLARFLSSRVLRELPRADGLPRPRTRAQHALLRRARSALWDACDAHLECEDVCHELNWAKLFERLWVLDAAIARARARRTARAGLQQS